MTAPGKYPPPARAVMSRPGLVARPQAQRLLAGQPAGQRVELDQIVHAASAGGLNGTFLLAGVLGLAGAVIVLAGLHRRPAPAQVPQPASAQSAPSQPAPAQSASAQPASAERTATMAKADP